MTSYLLRTAASFLLPLLLLFALFLYLRGHDEVGGGFVGGLVAAAAWALYALAFDAARARRALLIDPRLLIGFGLLVALASGLVGLFLGHPFLTGEWIELHLIGFGRIELGTPIIFDIGVFLTVLGVTLTIVFALEEE
jgi:multicomponent Na+:H+ antiporter subunit B